MPSSENIKKAHLSWTVTTVLAVIVTLVALPVLAQSGRGSGKSEPRYDPKSETRVSGTVNEVMEVDSPRYHKGVHLKLEIADVHREVCLGPTFYLEAEGMSFAVGDELVVVGSEVEVDGHLQIIARQIERGEETLTLRDERGVPRWARQGRLKR